MADEVESIKSKGVFIKYLWFLSKLEKWKNKSNLSNVKERKKEKEMTRIGGWLLHQSMYIAINKYIWIASSPPSNQSDCVHFLKGGFSIYFRFGEENFYIPFLDTFESWSPSQFPIECVWVEYSVYLFIILFAIHCGESVSEGESILVVWGRSCCWLFNFIPFQSIPTTKYII